MKKNKTKKNPWKGKCQEKEIRAKKKIKKKIHAEGRSNCDFYLIYKLCQCLLNRGYYMTARGYEFYL